MKTKVVYGGKITKIMDLTKEQIRDRNKLNEKTLKTNKKPYIELEVLQW